jgi:hypothetical protein
MADDKRVDESWKEKAKAEPGAAAPPPSPEQLPPADFNSLVLSLATGAFMALGPEAEKDKPQPADLPRARYTIDLLEMLAGTTKGNLTPDEDRRLAAILHQLRMAYVEAVRDKRN